MARIPREESQQCIDKLKKIYYQLPYLIYYPKKSARLLNQNCQKIEDYLVDQGVPKSRIDEIFSETLESKENPNPKIN